MVFFSSACPPIPHRVHNSGYRITDYGFPLAERPSPAEFQKEQAKLDQETADREQRVAALPDDKESLSDYVRECAKSLEQEESRRQSVESRLTSIMGLCSIAATIVFSGILGQATGTLHVPTGWLRWAMGLGALYLALQLCAAILAAVAGLERRSYSSNDLSPFPAGEARIVYLRRQIIEQSKALSDHRGQNDKKVTQMAIAHRALKNFLWSLLFVAVLGAFGAVTATKSDDLIDTLRNNRRLQDLLRGPQGPPSPKGEPCTSPQMPPAQPRDKKS